MFVTINGKVYSKKDIYCVYKEGLTIRYVFANGFDLVEEFNDEDEMNEKYNSFTE